MTILNLESDGLHSVLITLALMVAREKEIARDELIGICMPVVDPAKDKEGAKKARATVLRWISLGLFSSDKDRLKLGFSSLRGETPDAFAERLPKICRSLALQRENALPLWAADGSVTEDGIGLTADFCRGLAWCLAQDIYTLPSTYADIEGLLKKQVIPGRFIILNDTRWPGLRAWARYLGFATGDDSGLLFDPTVAVRSELVEMLAPGESMPASEFLPRLAERLPVLDTGAYRIEVEQVLRPETWRSAPADHLSTALSLALRRLQRQGTIALDTMADAGFRLVLVGQAEKTWGTFTHVRRLKEKQ
jgi:hypothetical protein